MMTSNTICVDVRCGSCGEHVFYACSYYLGIAPAAYLVCNRSSFPGEQVRIAVKFASDKVRRSMTVFSDSVIQVTVGILSSNTIHEDVRQLPKANCRAGMWSLKRSSNLAGCPQRGDTISMQLFGCKVAWMKGGHRGRRRGELPSR